MAKRWTKQEIETLKKIYPTANKEELERTFNRSISAITFKANNLDLKRQQYWTKKEEALLRKYYASLPDNELSELLGRTVASIRNKASRLNLKKHKTASSAQPWTQEEIKKLRQLYPTESKEVLTDTFNRSMNAIRNKAFQLGISRSSTKK